MDTVVEQEILHRSLGQRVVASAAGAFPYSPTGSLPLSPSATSKCMNFLLQQQHSESQRLMAASAAATTFMVGRNDPHNFLSRPMVERSDFAGMFNPSSRQIYLTFPADSAFREEDVSNYFSIYGPVQDVRIPYQQKRMFGFVTFVYPETVKLILAKGNPHFVCNARVLVKPYKEKGKIPDKKLQGEGVDFSGGSIPAGLDSRDPCDDQQQLGTRTLLGISNQDAVLMRKLEQHQELQQAIELQQRRIMGLHLLDLKRNLIAATATAVVRPPPPLPLQITASLDAKNARTSSDGDKSPIPECFSLPRADQEVIPKEDGGFQQSVEHNLPDSPFASLNKSSITAGDSCMVSVCSEAEGIAPSAIASTSASSALLVSSLLPATSTLEKSFTSCFLQMPRFSSGQGAMGL
ncbi:hypothetical protein HPP92_012562 [Vanilla planifolia]|uniref:RRM domain-containing protein n=1 Tax=Vanilla planifolia TaxID=51239 RepID=A0A835UZH1_VANPL|nr:hypothetical protein HPP92_012562 [Vanilla planifolia]